MFQSVKLCPKAARFYPFAWPFKSVLKLLLSVIFNVVQKTDTAPFLPFSLVSMQ